MTVTEGLRNKILLTHIPVCNKIHGDFLVPKMVKILVFTTVHMYTLLMRLLLV